jgi:hypothetical protein
VEKEQYKCIARVRRREIKRKAVEEILSLRTVEGKERRLETECECKVVIFVSKFQVF